MNSKILQKCLDELNKGGEADLSYIKGMIETLIEIGNPVMSMKTTTVKGTDIVPGYSTSVQPLSDPDPMVAMADAAARASLETIKEFADKSQNE